LRGNSHCRALYGGHDPGACARYFGALATWNVGYPDEALSLGGEALAFAERLAHPFSLQDCLLWNAMLHVDRGEAETALRRLAAVEALVAEQRLGFIVEPKLIRGAALTALGDLEEAVVCLREGLASSLGALLLRLYGIVHLAEALAGQAEYRAALDAATEGLKVQEETNHHQWGAELRRVQGVCAVRSQPA
jgi:tetratricopeptide (TPR) repeat protein